MKNILTIIVVIILLGIVGKMENTDNKMMYEIDQRNKQEVIKDIQIRCYNNELPTDYCKGF